jgi:hypothetical protein
MNVDKIIPAMYQEKTMPNPDPFQEDQTEQFAERQAYTLLHHANSFTHCLQQQQIAHVCKPSTTKGVRLPCMAKKSIIHVPGTNFFALSPRKSRLFP